jgi:hypothetical protein
MRTRAGLAHAAFQNVRDVELLCDRGDVDVLAFEVKGRGARGHPQAADLGEDIQQLLCQPICEIFVLLVAAHVHERKHGNRRGGVVNRRECGLERRKRLRQIGMTELIYGVATSDVAQRVLAQRS